jgi:hypothetical protein
MSDSVKRTLFKTFLNTGTVESPVWSLLGDGVTNAVIAYNPKVTEETYIINDDGTVSVDSYAPKVPIEGSAKAGDTVFDFVDALRKLRGIVTDAEAEVVNVWLYDGSVGGWYRAERQAVAIQIDDFGGEGGAKAKMSYTINYVGEPELGIFNPSGTPEFDGNPVAAVLTTMVIGAVTLDPLFSADHSNLLYSGTVANGTSSVAMTSTLAGSTIVQYDASDEVVDQAASADLAVGVNDLKIEVTVGDEVVTYHIDITREAA